MERTELVRHEIVMLIETQFEDEFAMVGIFQPGDGTKYEFMAVATKPGWIMSGGTLMRSYEFEVALLCDLYDKHKECIGNRNSAEYEKALADPHIGYMVSHTTAPLGVDKFGSHRFTCWAFVQWFVEMNKTGKDTK